MSKEISPEKNDMREMINFNDVKILSERISQVATDVAELSAKIQGEKVSNEEFESTSLKIQELMEEGDKLAKQRASIFARLGMVLGNEAEEE